MNATVPLYGVTRPVGRRDLSDRIKEPYAPATHKAEDQHNMCWSDVEETSFMAAVVAAPLLKSDLNISQRGDFDSEEPICVPE